jgi:hypothetical protein
MEKLILEEIQRMNLLSKYDNLKTLSEQANPALDIAKEIHASVSGPGTNPTNFRNGVAKIKDAAQFSLVNAELKKLYSKLDIAEWVNDDMGANNLYTVEIISKHLKSIGVNNSYESVPDQYDPNKKYFKQDSFKILTTPVAAPAAAGGATDPWAKYPCVVSHPNAKKTADSSGGVVYLIDGVYYYGNGRKMLANRTMGNYTCNDPEFKTAAAGGAAKKTKAPKTAAASVQSRIQNVQSQLGITGGTGKLDAATLQTMIDKLSAAAPAAPATDNQQLTQLSQQINTLNQAQA